MSEGPPDPPIAPPGGPYVTAACLCERVLQEADGVASLIRVVDRIINSAIGPAAPDEMPPTAVNLTAAIMLKSGSARGRHSLRLTLEAPSGQQVGPEVVLPVHLEGEERGVNFFVGLNFQAEHEGLYWFNVLFGTQNVLLTRIPLRIIYQPQRVTASSTDPDD